MQSNSSRLETRRTLLDGSLAISLLTLAIVVGYVVLAPGSLKAKTVRKQAVASMTQPATTAPEPAQSVSIGAPSTSPGGTTSSPSGGAVSKTGSLAPLGGESTTTAPAATTTPTAPATAPVVETPKRPWPATVTGRVLDPKREPVSGASVVASGRELFTAADGTFSVPAPAPGTPIVVKVPGFEKVVREPADGALEVVLKPQAIKAAYLTYYGFNDRGIRTRVLDLATKTELNAVVIDVKGDRGWVLYRTQVPQALAIGAQGPATIKDFDPMMADLKARGIYTIARIVIFKDNVLANARPDLAVIDTRTGKPWMDRENLAWVDPFREEVWDYNIALAKEAVARGFDEVQFDYVRFPTDGKLAAARYSKPANKDTRLPTIAAFLERARRQIGPTGAFLGADIFGYTAFNDNDTDIGQRIEELAPHLDYICPMVYPSGYHLGIPGYRNPVTNPYHVVFESVRLIRKRSGSHPAQVRPWLQDFRDYAFDRRIFGVPEIQAQIKGSNDGGGSGWMLWNPRNDYTAAALRQKLAAR